MTAIGLGSAFGDDLVGWRVVELLSRRLAPALARVLPLNRPTPTQEVEAAAAGLDRELEQELTHR